MCQSSTPGVFKCIPGFSGQGNCGRCFQLGLAPKMLWGMAKNFWSPLAVRPELYGRMCKPGADFTPLISWHATCST
jgi:hypothetical protein